MCSQRLRWQALDLYASATGPPRMCYGFSLRFLRVGVGVTLTHLSAIGSLFLLFGCLNMNIFALPYIDLSHFLLQSLLGLFLSEEEMVVRWIWRRAELVGVTREECRERKLLAGYIV